MPCLLFQHFCLFLHNFLKKSPRALARRGVFVYNINTVTKDVRARAERIKERILMKDRIRSTVLFCSLALLALALCSCSGKCLHLNMSERTFSPNCSEQGYILNTCQDCGYTFKSDVVAPYGHDLIASTTPPTCSTPGYTDYACSCGYHYTSDHLPPLGHDLVSKVFEPDCDEQGRTDYHCNRCSLAYSADFVAPLGHQFSLDVTAPVSCAVTGHTVYTCSACHYSYVGDFLFYSDVFSGAYTAATEPLAHGVDVSSWNHETDKDTGDYLPLDFEAIKAAGFDFVILKAGSTLRLGENGTLKGGLEPTFEADYAAAKAAGLDVGVYFYTYATTPEATATDARLLMSYLEGKQLEYPVYFDIEDAAISTLGRRAVTDLCVTFISELQANRYFGALYTNNNWLTNHLQTDKVTFLFDIWYARYPLSEGPFAWDSEKYGQHMGLWQYTQTGRIPTVSETVNFDFNYAYKDYPAIMRELGYNGYDRR